MTKEERLAALKALKTHLDRGICEEWSDGSCVIPITWPAELIEEVEKATDGLVYCASKFCSYANIALKKIISPAFEKGRAWVNAEIAEIEQPPFDPKEVIEAAAADQEGMGAAESLLDREQMRPELRTLWKTVGRQEAELLAMEQSRDEYKRLYQEALAAAWFQRINLEAKLKAAEPKDVQPAPVKMPAHRDVIEGRGSRFGDWEKVEVYAAKPEAPCFAAGGFNIKVCQATHDHGYWRWPEPRTRTAADAKTGDSVWVDIKSPILSRVITTILAVTRDHIHTRYHGEERRLSDFGTRWGYAEEQPK